MKRDNNLSTWDDHLKAGTQTINGLKSIKASELSKADECRFYQIKKKRKHLEKAAIMDGYIEKLGDSPSTFDAAMIVPDGILAEMGWE